MNSKHRKFIQVVLICIFLSGIYTGCKPGVPEKKDYCENDPCYYYDKCISLNAYTEQKNDCSVVLQKCLRYMDYKKCGTDKDCWEKVGIRY